MPGPSQKPAGTRARRNAPAQTTKLPAAGRASKRTPAWPLEPDVALTVDKRLAEDRIKQLRVEIRECDDGRVRRKLVRDLEAATLRRALAMARLRQQSTTERKMWAELWKTPQAAMWEKFGWSREVALYVRFQLQAEGGNLDSAKEARQRSDRLGLNPKAMASLKWEFERAEEAEERGRKRRQPAAPAKPAGTSGGKDPRGFLSVVS
jgi:hypothetical protein